MKKMISAAIILFAGIGTWPVQAQQPPADTGYTASVRASWNAIKRNISGSAQAMPDAGFAFKPTPEVRSFGELLGHLANEHYIFCSRMKGETEPARDSRLREEDDQGGVRQGHQRLDRLLRRRVCRREGRCEDDRAVRRNRRDTPFSSMLMNVTTTASTTAISSPICG